MTGAVCTACRLRPRRSPTQRHCAECHAADMRAFRARKKREAQALAWELRALRGKARA